MSRTHRVARGALPLLMGAVGAIAGCTSDANVLGPTPTSSMFQSYVAVGNSITAGFESDGINDSTQRLAFPFLLARSMRTRYAYASLAMPGCRPPINNFQTQTRVTLAGQPPSTAATCALRSATPIAAALNNVAVPGIASVDPTLQVEQNASALSQLILGGKSMVQKALDVQPTFATVWIGNNDVLQPAILGQLAGATPQATFAQNYSKMISELLAGAPGIKGVLIGVVQIAGAPVMITAQALKNAAFVAGLSQAAGKPITVDPTTCANSTSLIGFPIISQIRAGAHPPIIACEKTPTPPLGDIFVLDEAEQVQVKAIIDNYNAFIKAKADSIGFAYYDPNTTLARITALDPVLSTHVPNLASATATFGQYVSLDGIHPGPATHIEIEKDLVAVINAKYGTSLVP